MMKYLVIVALLGAVPCFAGECPSGIYSIQGTRGTLLSLGVTSCYYASKTVGSDTAYDGTQETISGAHGPFAHIPGMRSCTGHCSSASTAAGTGYILYGGDVWTASDLGILWTHSGTRSHPMYIGVDQTWYNSTNCGASWCRPVFNPAGKAMTGSYYLFANNGATALWLSVDNIEETGWSCTVMGSGNMNSAISADTEYENLYIHGWSYATGDKSCQVAAFSANISVGNLQVVGMYVHNNVVDGSDQNPNPVRSPTTTDSPILCALHGDRFVDNVCRYVYNINGLFNQVSGNWVDHILAGNSGDHCNMTNWHGILTGNYGYAFNNVYSNMNCRGGLILWLSGNTASATAVYYGFNNVFYNVNSGSAQRITTCTHPAQGSNCGIFYIFNNTDSASGGQLTGNGESSPRGIVNIANNHIIGTDSLCENRGVICKDHGNELFQCSGTGTRCAHQNVSPAFNRYSDSQTYADMPVAATNSTVHAGQVAATTFGITCTGVLAAACSDTTYATENMTNHTVVMRTANSRGRLWDIGAYQYAGSTPIVETAPVFRHRH